MKNKLIGLLIGIALITGFCWLMLNAFDRDMDNRCEAYADKDLFPYPTEIMKSVCPNLEGGGIYE